MERGADVLSGADLSHEPALRDRDPQLERMSPNRPAESDRGVDRQFVGSPWPEAKSHPCRGLLMASEVDGAQDIGPLIDDALAPPIGDELRREELARMQTAGVALLARGPCRRRERVGPADRVPVVDVKGKWDHCAGLAGLAKLGQ